MNYFVDLESLTEDADAAQYWLSKEPQYKCIGGLALDLWQHQLLKHMLFSVCGDLTARKRNKTKRSLENRVFLKLNYATLAKLPKGTVSE